MKFRQGEEPDADRSSGALQTLEPKDLSGIRQHTSLYCPQCHEGTGCMLTGWRGNRCVALMKCACGFEFRYEEDKGAKRRLHESSIDLGQFEHVAIGNLWKYKQIDMQPEKEAVEYKPEIKLIKGNKIMEGDVTEVAKANGTCRSSDCCQIATEGGKVYSTHEYIGSMSDDQKERCELIRSKFMELEKMLISSPAHGTRTFSDRCIAECRTKLEAASMYAIKSVVFEGKRVL